MIVGVIANGNRGQTACFIKRKRGHRSARLNRQQVLFDDGLATNQPPPLPPVGHGGEGRARTAGLPWKGFAKGQPTVGDLDKCLCEAAAVLPHLEKEP